MMLDDDDDEEGRHGDTGDRLGGGVMLEAARGVSD